MCDKDRKMDRAEETVRAHDLVIASGEFRASELDLLMLTGAAAQLAINLRNIDAVEVGLLKQLAVARLDLAVMEIRPALRLLEKAELISVTRARGTDVVVPEVPQFSDLYQTIGEAAVVDDNYSEHEQVTLAIMHELSKAPMGRSRIKALGAETKVINAVLDVATKTGAVVHKRARGTDIFLAPSYFAEDEKALADLASACKGHHLERVLSLLKASQGYPLSIIEKTMRIGTEKISKKELDVVLMLAQTGFTSPPSISTPHAGSKFFMFGPRPGKARLAAYERRNYENALALVSAMRLGEHFPKDIKIRSPIALLRALKSRGFVGANTEAKVQYAEVVQHGVARLVNEGGWHKLKLVRNADNERALDMAISMLEGEAWQRPREDEDLVIAIQGGEKYTDSLLGRKQILNAKRAPELDEETVRLIDDTLLGLATQ